MYAQGLKAYIATYRTRQIIRGGKTFAVGRRIHYLLENIRGKAGKDPFSRFFLGFQVFKLRHVFFATLAEIDCGKTFAVV